MPDLSPVFAVPVSHCHSQFKSLLELFWSCFSVKLAILASRFDLSGKPAALRSRESFPAQSGKVLSDLQPFSTAGLALCVYTACQWYIMRKGPEKFCV